MSISQDRISRRLTRAAYAPAVTEPAAVVFDLDGVLLDSEQVWDEARRELVAETGGRWTEDAATDMLGMSAPEWSRYVQERLGVPLAPDAIDRDVVDRVVARYARELPALAGARDAVERLGARWPLGLATSSNREVVEVVLDALGVRGRFAATVSSEEVARGKPSPDVYLEATRRLGVDPAAAVAIEDSANGIRSAVAAGLRVVAIPNPHFPPAPDALALAHEVREDLAALTPAAVLAAARR
jgi:HAD superfamily hydrolase (TIGR01509 family)